MFDYLIVGQGLAGTVLAHTLLKNNQKVYIVDNPSKHSASMVAAGIYNPVTGKRMVRSWLADTLFPFLKQFYTEMESLLQVPIIHDYPIYKPFDSIAEQNHVFSQNNFDQNYKACANSNTSYKEFISNTFGGLYISGGGFVNVLSFIQSSAAHFSNLNILGYQQFQYHDVVINNDLVCWKNIYARKVIFCEGSHSVNNPYFNWLPFILTKGEILNVKIENFPENVIFNKSVFVLPIGKSEFKVGSTYNWDFKNEEITPEAHKELTSKLESLIKSPYQNTAQFSGIRPTVSDRRPIIGLHPQYPQIGIFNGLGTKGVSLAPFFAHQFAAFLQGKQALHPEVNIERFYSLHLPK